MQLGRRKGEALNEVGEEADECGTLLRRRSLHTPSFSVSQCPLGFGRHERGKTFHFLLLRVAGRKVFVRVSHFLRFAYDVKYIAERFLLTGAYF